MPFLSLDEIAEKQPFPGYRVTFVHAETMTIAHFRVRAGAVFPEHSHPHEQVANVIEGEFEMTLGGETRRMGPRSVAVIPPNMPHSAKAITDCHIVDAFHPVREDYR